jgi:hypothetical protein
MAQEMMNKAGEDVCGCSMVSIDCVMASMPVEESELWACQKRLDRNGGETAFLEPKVAMWVAKLSKGWLMTGVSDIGQHHDQAQCSSLEALCQVCQPSIFL